MPGPAEHASTTHRGAIKETLIAMLEGMTAANGFVVPIKTVQMVRRELPSVEIPMVDLIRAHVIQFEEDTRDVPFTRRYHTAHFQIDCFLGGDEETMDERIDILLQDLRYQLWVNRDFNGYAHRMELGTAQRRYHDPERIASLHLPFQVSFIARADVQYVAP